MMASADKDYVNQNESSFIGNGFRGNGFRGNIGNGTNLHGSDNTNTRGNNNGVNQAKPNSNPKSNSHSKTKSKVSDAQQERIRMFARTMRGQRNILTKDPSVEIPQSCDVIYRMQRQTGNCEFKKIEMKCHLKSNQNSVMFVIGNENCDNSCLVRIEEYNQQNDVFILFIGSDDNSESSIFKGKNKESILLSNFKDNQQAYGKIEFILQCGKMNGKLSKCQNTGFENLKAKEKDCWRLDLPAKCEIKVIEYDFANKKLLLESDLSTMGVFIERSHSDPFSKKGSIHLVSPLRNCKFEIFGYCLSNWIIVLQSGKYCFFLTNWSELLFYQSVKHRLSEALKKGEIQCNPNFIEQYCRKKNNNNNNNNTKNNTTGGNIAK